MKFNRYLSAVFVSLVVICCFSAGCNEMQKSAMDVMMDGDVGPSERYLSLSSESPEAMIPINDSSEWAGWEHGIWEKVKGEELSQRPSNAFSVSSSLLNTFDYWFFSHAESKFDFALEDHDYVFFEGAVVRPHLCDGGAAIDVIWLADGVHVYKTGAITTKDIIKMEFEIPVGTKTLTLKVADVGDGSCNHYIIGNTRLLLEVPEGKSTYTGAYLSHYSESENAIRPTNHSNDWTHHNDGTWEKILGGEITKRQSGFLDWDINTFQHWIYAAVRSFMEFDLSDHDFVYFDSAVLLPNPCEGSATVQLYCLADGIEIYDSGVITGEEITRVGFDIPAGTEKLTLIMTDADDGRHCDHFVLGNSRFYTERPADAPPPQVGDVDPNKNLPEISLTPELKVLGRYRIRTESVVRRNYKITGLYKAIGDPEDRVEVRILLNPQPWSESLDGDPVIGDTILYGERAPDEIVVLITEKIRVYEVQRGRHTYTVHEYEGFAILNLSSPERIFEYEENVAQVESN